jgi:preprotein translocase subunit SecY
MILKNFSRLWDSHEVRNKVLVTIALVILYKFLTLIPVPGVSVEGITNLQKFLEGSQGLAFFSSLL